MANYDDIFNASAQKGTEDKSFVSFNKEEWAAQKKQERESAFAMIDETAQRMANDGSRFQSYLDVQARFDRYSVGNAVLITAQKADATQLSDFKGWKNNGVFIKKGESGIVLLEPGEEYTKEDGTVGVSYNSKKVFDISQTTAKAKDRPAMKRDERLLLKAIIHNAPCPIEISQKLPENINAVYRPDDKKIYVRPGLEAGDIFRGISQELAHAHLDDGAGITVPQMKAKLRRLKNLGLVVIDYLQLMESPNQHSSRVNEVSEITRQLKLMAKELNVPVIALSQLSRSSEKREDKRPMLSDLRESGSIEQDADIIIFLYRDAYYEKTAENQSVAECIVAKNRHGQTDTVNLSWIGEYTLFRGIDMRREDR